MQDWLKKGSSRYRKVIRAPRNARRLMRRSPAHRSHVVVSLLSRCCCCCCGGGSGGGWSGGSEGCDKAVVIGGVGGGVVKVVVVVALLLLGSQFIHGTYKLPQKTMRVHIARCTQYIHVRSHELKLPKICIPIKYIIAPLSTHTHTTQKVQI